VTRDDAGGSSSTHGEKKNTNKTSYGNPKDRDQLGDRVIDGSASVILTLIVTRLLAHGKDQCLFNDDQIVYLMMIFQ
jgi:hypothetical protein